MNLTKQKGENEFKEEGRQNLTRRRRKPELQSSPPELLFPLFVACDCRHNRMTSQLMMIHH